MNTAVTHPAPEALILAFEGVLAPPEVLRDTLEPYTLGALPGFLERHAETPAVRRILADILAYSERELDHDGQLAQIQAWIHGGQDITPVRQLQGLIWSEALDSQDLQPEFSEDTAQTLQKLADAGVTLHSFGATPTSVQRSWLRHGPYPNLEPRLSGWFDTRLGGRRDAGSYRRLANEIGAPPEAILVLSTRVDELDAARQAWLQTGHPGPSDTAPAGAHPYRKLSSLIPASSRSG